MSALGLSNLWSGGLPLGAAAVTATGTVAMTMALGLFGKRRRSGEQRASDEELAEAAALGMGGRVHPRLVPKPEEVNPEADLPRWLRPSLLQARKADPLRNAAVAAPPLAFTQGAIAPTTGRERRRIRHRVVRILDSPDELRGAEIGFLDRDDEVELLEKYGAYWLILCPNGSQGWVHNMTLGEVVQDTPREVAHVVTFPRPIEGSTPGKRDDGATILDTYLAAHRRGA